MNEFSPVEGMHGTIAAVFLFGPKGVDIRLEVGVPFIDLGVPVLICQFTLFIAVKGQAQHNFNLGHFEFIDTDVGFSLVALHRGMLCCL